MIKLQAEDWIEITWDQPLIGKVQKGGNILVLHDFDKRPETHLPSGSIIRERDYLFPPSKQHLIKKIKKEDLEALKLRIIFDKL